MRKIEKNCNNLENELLQGNKDSIYIVCKDCKEIFEFNEENQKYFSKRNWKNPIRCKSCRKVHKQNKEKYGGIYETMNNNDKMRCKSKPRSIASKIYNGYRM